MVRRVILTLSTAASLCGLFSLYSAFVSPVLQPISRPRLSKLSPQTQAAFESRNTDNQRLAKLYLPKVPWTREAGYQGRQDDLLIYAQEVKVHEDKGVVSFSPFAMIMIQSDSAPEDEPITIVSDSAEIKFADKFDMERLQPGRIVAGNVQGNVVLRDQKSCCSKG